MKIKIFEGTINLDFVLEKEVNDWLQNHPQISIIHWSTVMNDKKIVITIGYKEVCVHL